MESHSELVLLVHCVSTLCMCGIIWFVQVVHYPLFASVGEENFIAYEQKHCFRTGLVVGPLMVIELFSAVLLLGIDSLLQYELLIANFVVLVLTWITTVCLQVPAHNSLSSGFSLAAHNRLVRSNWLRTIAWSARGVMVCTFLAT